MMKLRGFRNIRMGYRSARKRQLLVERLVRQGLLSHIFSVASVKLISELLHVSLQVTVCGLKDASEGGFFRDPLLSTGVYIAVG